MLRIWLVCCLTVGLGLAGCSVRASSPGQEGSELPLGSSEETPGINSTGTVIPLLEATKEMPAATIFLPTDVLAASPSPTRSATVRQSLTPTFDPNSWSKLPVLPIFSQHARRVLADGIAMGNNPRAFSKIGDCESRTTWFLGDFDLDSQYYSLGPYEAELAPVIDYYKGSYNRLSLAAKPGFTAASLLSPIWADREVCQKGESPLACEYRSHRPVAAFIMIGTNDAVNPKTFEGHMRKVIETSLEYQVLPILGTKADNIEGDHAINATLARLAYEYDVPLWNYWMAVQDLPGHGLQEDGSHLTFSTPHYDDPATLRYAWPVRNLNALQILRQIMDITR